MADQPQTLQKGFEGLDLRSAEVREKVAKPLIQPYDPNDFGDGRREPEILTTFSKNLAQLQAGLKLGSDKDVKDWIEGRLFKPHFDTYLNDCVVPEREKKNGQMPTASSYTEVRNAIKQGEAGGYQKYSSFEHDKTDWEVIDHQALCLYRCTVSNFKNIAGILKADRGFSWDTAMWAIWQAMRWKMNRSTPSNLRRRNQGELGLSPPETSVDTSAASELAPTLLHPQVAVEQDSTQQDITSSEPSHATPIVAEATGTGSAIRGVSPSMRLEPDDQEEEHEPDDREEENEPALLPAPEQDLSDQTASLPLDVAATASPFDSDPAFGTKSMLRKRKAPDDQVSKSEKRQSTGAANVEETEYLGRPALISAGREDDRQSQGGQQDDDTAEAANPNSQDSTESTTPVTQTPIQQAIEEWPKGEKFNLAFRYCRIIATHLICKAGDKDLEPWLRQHIEKLAADSDVEHWTGEAQAWFIEQMKDFGSKQLVYKPEVTNEELEKARKQQDLMNPTPIINVDLAVIAAELGLEGGTQPRTRGMPMSQRMSNLQVCGLYEIMKFRKTLAGCILADAMGLGKTLQMINLIQQTNFEYARDIENGRTVDPPTPHLFIVPGNLIEQVCGEFRAFAPQLQVRIYHGDNRKATRGGYKCIQGSLHHASDIFNGKSGNENIVVITTISTLDTRHGPQVLKAWRKKQTQAVAKNADELYSVPDFSCPHLLSGLFNNVIVDEAHCLKRLEGSYSKTVQWLKPRFTLLATATPAINSPRDWEGYLAFVQPRDTLRLPSTNPPQNPYLTDSQLPGQYCLLQAVAAEHIFRDTRSIHIGVYTAKLQEQCAICRGYGTLINGERVGEAMPTTLKRRLDPSFSPEAKELYDLWSAEHVRKLIRAEGKPPNTQIMWNQKHYRHLVLLCTWLGFEAISDDVLSDNLDAIKKDPNVLLKWMKKVQAHRHSIGLDYELPEVETDTLKLIGKICEESPKIALLLGLLSDETATLKENLIVWSLFPGVQVFLWVILKTLGYDVSIVSSDMNSEVRNAITTEFNEQKLQGKVLLLTYALSSYGLNLQKGCHIDIHMDIPPSMQIWNQACARIGRWGQLYTCISYTMAVKNTFNDRQMNNVLQKAFGTVMAELNPTIFKVTALEDEDGDVKVALGAQFVDADGVLCEEDSPEARNAVTVQKLDTEGVINWILEAARGRKMETSLDAIADDAGSEEGGHAGAGLEDDAMLDDDFLVELDNPEPDDPEDNNLFGWFSD